MRYIQNTASKIQKNIWFCGYHFGFFRLACIYFVPWYYKLFQRQCSRWNIKAQVWAEDHFKCLSVNPTIEDMNWPGLLGVSTDEDSEVGLVMAVRARWDWGAASAVWVTSGSAENTNPTMKPAWRVKCLDVQVKLPTFLFLLRGGGYMSDILLPSCFSSLFRWGKEVKTPTSFISMNNYKLTLSLLMIFWWLKHFQGSMITLRERPIKSSLLHVAVFVRVEILDISILESMRRWDEEQMSRSFAC